jgi:protein gp37
MYTVPDQSITDIISTYYADDFSGVHPAANIFPMPSPDEFNDLCASIKTHGLEDCIIRHKSSGKLLDGRSRFLACFTVNQELRIVDVDTNDPINYSMVKNQIRRQLSFDQKAIAAGKAKQAYADEAKERQRLSEGRGKKGVAPVPPREKGKARDKAGQAFGVGGKSVDKAADIVAYAPEVAEKVAAGETTLAAAAREAAPAVKKGKAEKKAAKQNSKPQPKPAEMINIVSVDGELFPVKKQDRPTFNKTNANVDWAGYTWNPVTGCNHGCEFCYAREIANDLYRRQNQGGYVFNFKPAFHPGRLDAPCNTKPGEGNNGRVFVCSMADLFGKWVPDEWITAVFNACMKAPDWEYMFLTKWPKRYAMLKDLPKAYFGASIIKQVDVARVERDMMSFTTNGLKWISLEPMLEPITFSDLSWCDMVVIGAQTKTIQPSGVVPEFAPDMDWIVDVIVQCREFGVPYYLKPNLESGPGINMPRPPMSLC